MTRPSLWLCPLLGQVRFPTGRVSTADWHLRLSWPSFTAPTAWSVSNFLAPMPGLAMFPHPFGAVAQLGERRTGSAEVWGSIPHSSTEENALF